MPVPSDARLASSLRWITDQPSPMPCVLDAVEEPAEVGPVLARSREVDRRRDRADDRDAARR